MADEDCGALKEQRDASDNRAGKAAPSMPQLEVSGEYVCQEYDATGGRNDWHYVTIVELGCKCCIWKNKAGVIWMLSATSDPLIWSTGPDCCYYKDGHRTARFTVNNEVVVSVTGPGEESYTRVQSLDVRDAEMGQSTHNLEGSYECHDYDGGGKNDWHYVIIAKSVGGPSSSSSSSSSSTSSGTYTWTNKAGASWSLYRTSHPLILAVGVDCPYYEETKAAIFTSKGGEIISVSGPGNEQYLKKRFTHNFNAATNPDHIPGTSTSQIPGTSSSQKPCCTLC